MIENGLIVFDIIGSMAHFRKFYTNSSSLSYAFPPRTAVAGMIAAILGYERDSYYELLDKEHCGITVSVRTGIRHVMQTVNYVRTKALREVNGSFGPTQVPLDIVMPSKNEAVLQYRIYFCHEDTHIMDKVQDLLGSGRTVFPLYMGITEFIASGRYVAHIDNDAIQEVTPGIEVDLATVCNIEAIADGGLNFKADDGHILQYIKERMPIDFGSQRQLKAFGCYIFEKNHQWIRAKLNVPCYHIKYCGIEENIIFM